MYVRMYVRMYVCMYVCMCLYSTDRLDEVYDSRRGLKYQDMVDRDKRRFEAADENNDGKLDRDEFAIYLHPEDTAYMREVVIAETLQDMDTNKDGFVDLEEYMSEGERYIVRRREGKGGERRRAGGGRDRGKGERGV